MELRHLRYFIILAEELHFGKAASKLFISQPPLSRQIKELEMELGVMLFDRSEKKVKLTDAGVYFKAQIDELFIQLDATKLMVKRIHEEESGELKIGYVSSVYQHDLAKSLKDLQQEFPFVKTLLYEVPTAKQIESLEKGDLDIGILRAPVNSVHLTQHSLYLDPFMIALPKQERQSYDLDAIINFIKNQPFIFFNHEYAPEFNQRLHELCERLGFQPNIAHEVNNVGSILQLVEAGLGISILPLSLSKHYGNLSINYVSLASIPIYTEILLAYKKGNLSNAAKSFIDRYQNMKR